MGYERAGMGIYSTCFHILVFYNENIFMYYISNLKNRMSQRLSSSSVSLTHLYLEMLSWVAVNEMK